MADVLATGIRAAQRVDLSEVIRRALRLPLHHTGERRRNQQLHHDPAQQLSLSVSVSTLVPPSACERVSSGSFSLAAGRR